MEPLRSTENRSTCLNGINKQGNSATQFWMIAKGDGEDETDLPDWCRENIPTLKRL